MKYTLLITLQLFAFTAFSQLDLPSWLQSTDTGEYLTVKGGIFTGLDSASTEGYVTIIRHGSSKDLYRFNFKKGTSLLDLNAQLQVAPQGFDKSVSMIPCMIAKFDPEIKFFVFDEEFAKIRKEATVKEIERCKQKL